MFFLPIWVSLGETSRTSTPIRKVSRPPVVVSLEVEPAVVVVVPGSAVVAVVVVVPSPVVVVAEAPPVPPSVVVGLAVEPAPVEPGSPDEEPPALAPSRHEAALELRDLQRALEHLSPEQREVLLLVGLEQLDYAEVASVLGIPPGTVMSRLARAREALRRALREPPRARLRRIK